MNGNRLFTVLALLLGVALAGIFASSSFEMFILLYVFVFVVMAARSLYVAETLRVRVFYLFVHLLIMVLQIAFTVLVTFQCEENAVAFVFYKLVSTLIVFFSPIVEKIIASKRKKAFFMPSIHDFAVITYAELARDKEKIEDALNMARKAGQAFSKENLQAVVSMLPEHNSFRYINNGSLSEAYFDAARESLADEHIYIVLTDSGSVASEIISVFTGQKFNHVSISFDRELRTIVSYNGGEHVFPPGLNLELIEWFHKKANSSVMVYRIRASKEQKKKMIAKIREINEEGSAYNLLGLVLKVSARPNILFCSQFVYQMLRHVGLSYFEKKSTDVKPSDMVELDYHRKLEFVYEIKLGGSSDFEPVTQPLEPESVVEPLGRESLEFA